MRIVKVERIGGDLGLTRGGVATLGVFDGVHLGHQRILRRVREQADSLSTHTCVLTFAVHPVVVVKGLPPRLITSLPHRLRLFDELGIDECGVLPFDDAVRRLSPEEFARMVFVEALKLQALILGPDAHVGKDRAGDADFLASFCARHDIALEVVEDLRQDHYRISSTRIRAAIADGDLARARGMLGRDVSMLGTVVRGDGRGRRIGYATANLDLHHEIRPPAGVYAVRVKVEDQTENRPGVVNIGIRPTFGPDGDLTVEAHLFDFDGDLYDRNLEVVLVRRIRDEMAFQSKAELISQIERDCQAARVILATD